MKSDFFLLRVPLFPFEMTDLGKEESIALFRNPIFNEAIQISSPELFQRLVLFNNGEISEREEWSKLYKSLYRYVLRMSFRCTPFGLFAGTAIGRFDSTTNIVLADIFSYKKFTRIDSQYLNVWALSLLQNEDAFRAVTWYTNNTIYKVGEKLRYIEYTIRKGVRSHTLSTVEDSEQIQQVLTNARDGKCFDELVNVLLLSEVTVIEAVTFVKEMILCKLLVSELELNITGDPYHNTLAEKIRKKGFPESSKSFLEQINIGIEKISHSPIGSTQFDYQSVVRDLQKSAVEEIDGRMLLQTDLKIATDTCTLSERVKTEIADLAFFLAKTSSRYSNPTLDRFKEEFSKRFESQEVFLNQVLDPDLGIGYPAFDHSQGDVSPLIDGIGLSEQQFESTRSLDSRDQWLVQKLIDSEKKAESVIHLTDDDVPLGSRHLLREDVLCDLPRSLYTICSIFDEGAGYSMLYDHTSGPSGVNLLGRFCHSNPEMQAQISEHIKEEEFQDDVIFAEVVHFSQSRQANVLIRPVLRKYEIPILTHPGVKLDRAIYLDDILVSLRGSEIILTSKRLGKRIIPRLSNAHDYSFNSLPHYHFLCDIQTQERKKRLHWEWGFLSSQVFLPRVTYKNAILCPAQWTINQHDFVSARKKSFCFEDFLTGFSEFKRRYSLPNVVLLTSGDNQIPLKLQDSLALEILFDDLKRLGSVVLKESLFHEKNLLVKGPFGAHTNEVVIPWINTYARPFRPFSPILSQNGQRSVIIGGGWIFFKIYCGVKSADKLLVEVILPIANELVERRIVDKWFFIRYADPDHHLRVRFSGKGDFYSEVIRRINLAFDPYLQNHLVWRIQTDTYNPEVERYGASNIENSETLFFHDSSTTVRILTLLNGDEGDNLRWQFAIKGVDDLLESFDYDLLAKKELLELLSSNFKIEFNVNSAEARKKLGAKFRELRSAIELALKSERQPSHLNFEAAQLLEIRKGHLAACAKTIDQLLSESRLEVPRAELVASYIHMFLNRFLRSKQRMQEMVIYDLLHQYYKSMLAKAKK